MKYYSTKWLMLVSLMVCCDCTSAQMNGTDNHLNQQVYYPSKVHPAVQRLSRAIDFETISYTDTTKINYKNYLDFIQFLNQSYPLVHQHLERRIINQYSLLYVWKGQDTSLPPILLLGHYDVVPVDSTSLAQWKYDPFGGEVDSSHIWGRGTMDDKFRIISLLEAIEELLKEGFVPERSIYLAFGHDEETGGEHGALQISKYLQSQNTSFEMILDEGGAVTERIYPGIKKPIAFIGTAEKGHMNVDLFVHAISGHSSAPPKETAIAILAEAISKINKHPIKMRLVNPTAEMLETLKPFCNGRTKLALNNKWLFKNKILKKLSEHPVSNALVRTVITPTLIRGGIKENSLPSFATANLNIRILPDESVESVLQHIESVVCDNRVTIRLHSRFQNPSGITSSSSKPYLFLRKLINSRFPDAIVCPMLSIAATDSYHYNCLSRNILRFAPILIMDEDKEMMHGDNERIGIRNYMNCIRFYYDLMKVVHTEF